MAFQYIGGEYLPDYARKATWKHLHAYIDVHSKIINDEYPEDGVQAISTLQSQFSNMTFSDKRRYIRLFQKVIHKGGESAISYIKILYKYNR